MAGLAAVPSGQECRVYLSDIHSPFGRRALIRELLSSQRPALTPSVSSLSRESSVPLWVPGPSLVSTDFL